MKAADGPFEEMEQRLRQARLAGPSAELKTRIVGSARETWSKAPADIPWRIPLRHLAVSAAAAVLIVSCANYFSRRGGGAVAGRPARYRPDGSGPFRGHAGNAL